MLRARSYLAVLVFGGLAISAAARLEEYRASPYDVLLVPPRSVARVISVGHPTLAANVYWLRAVQYIGEPAANARGWERLYPILDLVTDLDPEHGYAYQVGGVILGTARRIAESNALLEKGMRAVPRRYILPFIRAFNAFYYEDDWALAGRFMEQAARVPGAPAHLTRDALAFAVKGNRADQAIAFLQQMMETTPDPETRGRLQTELQQAYLERDALVLDAALERHRATYGMNPITLEVLVAEGLVDRIPSDPFGGIFVVGSDGRAHSSVNDFRFARPERLARLPPEPGLAPQGR